MNFFHNIYLLIWTIDENIRAGEERIALRIQMNKIRRRTQ